jgi:hypothetical protein
MTWRFGNPILKPTDMNYKKIRLLESQEKEYFLDCVDELYGTIAQDQSYEVTREQVKHSRQKNLLVRVLSHFPFLSKLHLRVQNEPVINFAAMISGDFKLLLPYAFLSKHNFIYMYDAWPRFHKWIFPLLDFLNVRFVFFSAKQAWISHQSSNLQSRCKSMWLPEAINAAEYHPEPFENKDIDVLEFGRIYQEYHDRIRPALESSYKMHVYPKPGTALLFPNRASFIKGLGRAKLVICVPSDITHPERAENISTMTLRYLQAMVSKVLIVGKMPSDMEELFPYLPIVELDMTHAGEQIVAVLDAYETYIPLIERNYAEVWKHHQWSNRWEVIKSRMEAYND